MGSQCSTILDVCLKCLCKTDSKTANPSMKFRFAASVDKETDMPNLKNSKTEENLKAAFAGESQANRRERYFANKADIEGQNDVAALFRSTAEGETGQAHGHLEYLEKSGDPATGMASGPTADYLKTAIAGDTLEFTDLFPGMAKDARSDGFDEFADWLETLAK